MDGDQDVFVLWPEEDDPDWRDTGEGGLFAYGVYRAIGEQDRAHVDVNAHLHSPRLPLGKALGAQLWAPPVVGGPVGRRPSIAPWSRPLRAALFLGSCPRSLVHVETGEPFQVDRGALTQTGEAIMHSLDYEYRFRGDVLTFCGVPQRRRRWSWSAVKTAS